MQRCIGAKTDALSFRPQRLALAARQGVNRTELILQNPSSTPDPAAPPPAPPGGGDAAWAQVASDLKAVQQQALATQRAIEQLQAQQEAPAHASGWPVSMVLPAGGWGVAVVLVLAAALLAWWLRRRSAASVQPIAHDSITSDLADDPNSMMELRQTVQEQEISQWAPEPETKEDLVSDWGAIPLVRADPVTTFDLEAATGEVTRVRQTLAQRRHERALQRERDARLLREAAERADDAALAIKLQAVPHRGSWVPDLDLSQDIDAQEPAAPGLVQVKPVCAIEPSTGPLTDPNSESVPAPQPLAPLSLVEIPPMNTYALEADPVAAPSPAPLAVPDNTPVDVYAVKLALAHESEAIELWTEASALAEEVLAAPDAALRTQAQATLQRLALKIQWEEQGDDGVPAAAARASAAAPVGDVPPMSEPQPEPQEDVYAVKLALAQESEAVELWDEARELAEEVLASPDPALIAQAQALLTAIAQKLDTMAQDSMPFNDALEANKTVGR